MFLSADEIGSRVHGEDFQGVIGRYYDESEPWWPDMARARPDSPNVVLVVLDDVGFAQLGCFGSDLDTPVFDRLAAGGLRYTNFHTTALCSPTRACLLTGRNHHSNGMGRIIDLATGFPGYDAHIPKRNGFLSEILTAEGYAAYAVGKWHLTPHDETHVAAPRERWPLGRGFDRFYGFFGGETHQFSPVLHRDSSPIGEPPGSYETGYHLTEDLVDNAIGYVRDLRAADADKPFFLYLCPGACHSPHQAPDEWIERYRGQFDEGWDAWRDAVLARQLDTGVLPSGTELSPRPDYVPAWDELTDDQRTVYARYMEAFAGFLSHTDHEVGRLVDFLERLGELDNTIFIVLSDNGASSEGGVDGSLNDVRTWNWVGAGLDEALENLDEIGGPRFHNNYPWGWTIAGNTPFKRWKRETHEGGVADPLIIHWPAGIEARGENRRQYVHAIDLAPTILDVIGIDQPDEVRGVKQAPIDGKSFAATLRDADAPAPRITQYYEMLGCRAIYHDGWKAVVYHPVQTEDPHLREDEWELYHVAEDPSEINDLAGERPDKLRELVERWWIEASRYQVLPLDNRPFSEFVLERPHSVPERPRNVYLPGAAMVPEAVAVNVRNRDHRVIADITVPDGGGEVEGVLIAQGSILGGWTLFVKDGRLTYVHNLCGVSEDRIEADLDLSPGDHTLGYAFDRKSDLIITDSGDIELGGTGRLLVDGDEVASVDIPKFTALRFSITGHGLTCGRDGVLAVVDDYTAPFPFAGADLHKVVVEVDGVPHIDPEGEAHVAVATQ